VRPCEDDKYVQNSTVIAEELVVDAIITGVHCADLDFSVRGAGRRHFSPQVMQLFRRKFRR
jgi:hypothetical protein